MIELRHISKIYGDKNSFTAALEDINLTIEAGEFIAICGESGTGKSTLLNIIGCIDKPTSGEYLLDGNIIDYNRHGVIEDYRKEKFSFIFQNFALMERYTIYENIEMPLIAKNIRRKKRRELIEQSVKDVNLNEPLYKYPSELSGGQRQRVAIARTLAMGNPIILADEPTGALDEKNATMLMDIFLGLKQKGNTIIMVTHNRMLAECADRIIEMETLKKKK